MATGYTVELAAVPANTTNMQARKVTLKTATDITAVKEVSIKVTLGSGQPTASPAYSVKTTIPTLVATTPEAGTTPVDRASLTSLDVTFSEKV